LRGRKRNLVHRPNMLISEEESELTFRNTD